MVLIASFGTAMAPDEEEVAVGATTEDGSTRQRCAAMAMGIVIAVGYGHIGGAVWTAASLWRQWRSQWVLLQHDACDGHGPAMGIVMAVEYGHIDNGV